MQYQETRRSVKATTGIALLYLLMAVAVTWPGIRTISSRFIGGGGGDGSFICYLLGWGYRCLGRGLTGFWNAPFYFPLPAMTTYSDHVLGLEPFFAKAMLASGNPVFAYNVTYLCSLALTGFAAFLLARLLAKNGWAAFLAGGLRSR